MSIGTGIGSDVHWYQYKGVMSIGASIGSDVYWYQYRE